ncbi:hypothetical protein HZC20_01565 [Candidatus Peregrinibacteria bacterium]|nr:hypothetical protein [Candidatus Peregrinibacteria bacterium]
MDLSRFNSEIPGKELDQYLDDMLKGKANSSGGKDVLWLPFSASILDIAWSGGNMELAKRSINETVSQMRNKWDSWCRDLYFIGAVGKLALPDLYCRRENLMNPENNLYYDFSGTPKFREACIRKNLELVNATIAIFEAIIKSYMSKRIDDVPSDFDYSASDYDYTKDAGAPWVMFFDHMSQHLDPQIEKIFREVTTALARTLLQDGCLLVDPILSQVFVDILGHEDWLTQLMTRMTKMNVVSVGSMVKVIGKLELFKLKDNGGSVEDIIPYA